MESWFDRITPEDRVYYTRLIFGVVAASICLIFYPYFSGFNGIYGFLLGLMLVIFSYFIAIYLLRVDPEEVGGHVRGIIKGLGTGILLFLVIWLLGYNFIYATLPP